MSRGYSFAKPSKRDMAGAFFLGLGTVIVGILIYAVLFIAFCLVDAWIVNWLIDDKQVNWSYWEWFNAVAATVIVVGSGVTLSVQSRS